MSVFCPSYRWILTVTRSKIYSHSKARWIILPLTFAIIFSLSFYLVVYAPLGFVDMTMDGKNMAVWFLPMFFLPVYVLISELYSFRRKLRERYNLRDSAIQDCLAWTCFGVCALAQEAHHVSFKKIVNLSPNATRLKPK